MTPDIIPAQMSYGVYIEKALEKIDHAIVLWDWTDYS